jgi:hypothetical protein
MALETYELDKKILEYSISQFRNIPEYVKMCEAFAVGLGTIQTSVDYLSDMIDLDKAEGIWLDYVAWLVGTNRTTYDILQYFCVNAPHLNVEKYFYFEGISSLEKGTIQDVALRKRIKAKIAYNTSKATRNENIKIIEGLVNADKVVITNVEPMVLDITLYGEHLFYPSTQSLRASIENILGNGVGVRNLTIL